MIDMFNQLWLKSGMDILRPELAWVPLTTLITGFLVWVLWDALKVSKGKMLVADELALRRMFISTGRPARLAVAALAISGLWLVSISVIDPANIGLTPREEAVVMPILDISGSMNEMDAAAPGEPAQSRINAAVDSTRQFVSELPEEFMVGLTVYADSSDVNVLVTPRQDRQAIFDALDQIEANGGTALGEGIEAAAAAIDNFFAGARYLPELQPPSMAVLLSDGVWDQGIRPEDAVKQYALPSGLSVNTISFGRDGSELDPATMQMIAESTGGQYFSAENAQQLDSVYEELQELIGYERTIVSVAYEYSQIGMVLLGLAALMAMLATRNPITRTTQLLDEETQWKLSAA